MTIELILSECFRDVAPSLPDPILRIRIVRYKPPLAQLDAASGVSKNVTVLLAGIRKPLATMAQLSLMPVVSADTYFEASLSSRSDAAASGFLHRVK